MTNLASVDLSPHFSKIQGNSCPFLRPDPNSGQQLSFPATGPQFWNPKIVANFFSVLRFIRYEIVHINY